MTMAMVATWNGTHLRRYRRMMNKLNGEFNARVWANEFVGFVSNKPEIATDEGTMIGWFANAIMAGYDKGVVGIDALRAENERLNAENEKLKDAIVTSHFDGIMACLGAIKKQLPDTQLPDLDLDGV
jgi:hypothetical protein